MIPGLYILLLLLVSGGMYFWKKSQAKALVRSLNKYVDRLSAGPDGGQSDILDDGSDLPSEFEPVFQRIKHLLAEWQQAHQGKKDETPGKYNELKKAVDNLHIVNELGRKVTSSLSLDQTFRHLYSTINSMMDAAVLELAVHAAESEEKKFYSSLEAADPAYANLMADWSFRNNREVFLADAQKDFARYVFQPLVLGDGTTAGSVMVFPIMNGERVTGTLSVISREKNSYSDYHRDIIRLLLGYISVAIENAMRHEELNAMKVRAEKGEKFKEQFLANMSHEIRTPINAVTGMTHLLLEKNPRPDQLRYLESIRNASDALLVIINDILDLSKIEAGKIELEHIGFSVDELIGNVKEIMQFKAEEKGLALVVSRDRHVPPLLVGDPTRLTQILINLVGNAIKFTEKGSVSIRVVRPDQATPAQADGREQVTVRFEVMDTGIGMTTDQQARLFRDYAQASPETARKYGGTGLGLSISKQLVALQGGEIGVNSRKGEGSTFFFTLTFPVSDQYDIPGREQGISDDVLAKLNGMHILVADDNEYNRIVVREMLGLRISDLHIDEAQDGEEAVQLIRDNDYDLVLMDLVMPRMDGLEATRIIRHELPDPKRNVPVLALTAYVVESEMDKCFAAGMNGFVPKPFKTIELFGPICKAMAGVGKIPFEAAVEKKPGEEEGRFVDPGVLDDQAEGDEVRKRRFMELFLEKTPAGLAEVSRALENGDFENLRIAVHSMKPQLLFTGVAGAADLVERIESLCLEKKDTGQLPALVSKLREVCLGALREVHEMKSKQSHEQ